MISTKDLISLQNAIRSDPKLARLVQSYLFEEEPNERSAFDIAEMIAKGVLAVKVAKDRRKFEDEEARRKIEAAERQKKIEAAEAKTRREIEAAEAQEKAKAAAGIRWLQDSIENNWEEGKARLLDLLGDAKKHDSRMNAKGLGQLLRSVGATVIRRNSGNFWILPPREEARAAFERAYPEFEA